jgi:8-oxo-dGTP pyrophosphatase MutT (NUDIX family)
MKGLKPPRVAAQEAFEEAGLVGRIIGKQPIGTYHYEKRLPNDQLLCEVWVFLLWVDHQLDDWAEKSQRETRWFNQSETVDLVDEGGLAEVIRHAFASRAIAPGSRRHGRWL